MSNILDKYRKRPIKTEDISFFSSIYEDLWILKEDIIGSIAHVIMLKDQKILNENEGMLILKSLKKIYELVKSNNFVLDTSYEDIHPYIESLVIKDIGIEIGGKIHSARSRNDQVALDIRLKIRSEFLKLFDLLDTQAEILIDLAKHSIDYYCPLYTHLQRGQLGVFAQYFLNYVYQIIRILKNIVFCYDIVNQNPLGACAIGGTSFPIDRTKTTHLLGMDSIIRNSIDAVSSRDYLIETSMVLTLLADFYTRISEDFVIWSSREFSFIEIADEYCSVSSAMPQKKNPDSVELIRGRMSRAYAALNQILFMSKGTPTGYNRDFQESKVALKYSFDTILQTAEIFNKVLKTIKINKEALEKASSEGFLLALDLAEYLSQNFGISFREAHQIVGFLVQNYSNKREIFSKENIQNACLKITNKTININGEDLIYFNNFETILNNRKSAGAPNKKNIEESIKECNMLIEELKLEKDIRSKKVQTAFNNLMKYIENL